MGAPYKMKYTNGKKADASAFPFSNIGKFGLLGMLTPEQEKAKQTDVNPDVKVPASKQQVNSPASGNVDPVLDEQIENKVNEVVNQKASEGLV